MRCARVILVCLLVACGERNIDLIESRDGKPCVICGKACVVLEEDPKHCGACGMKCGMGEQCCGGACTKVDMDPANCGQCGTACPVDGMCMGGKCSCPPMSVFCGDACVMPGTVPECE
jgi:hypothetical protein